MATANTLLACLLALFGFSVTATDAARTPQQRREWRNPYVMLPPGGDAGQEYGSGGEWRSQDLGETAFQLRHIYHHGSHHYPLLHRYHDVDPSVPLLVSDDYGRSYESAPTTLKARANTLNMQRLAKRSPTDIDHLLAHADLHGEPATLASDSWTTDEVPSPNTTDRDTILTFAKIASNAYVQEHGSPDWKDVKGGFNYTDDFGWEADGLRGHIFADQTNKTIIIGLKGSSSFSRERVSTLVPTRTPR